MNYGLLEDEIVARLAPIATAGHEVEAMPSIPVENSSIKHSGRITVQVGAAKGDTGDIQSQSSASDQYEDVFVEIIIRSKRLRTSNQGAGIYDLSELARKLLQGWRSSMSLMPFEFVDFAPLAPDNITDSIFTYSLRMKTQGFLATDDEEDLSVLINQITVLPDSQTGPLAPIGEIFASAYSVNSPGDQIVLAWISENGYSVEINGVGTELEDSGSATVTVSANTTYTLTVTRDSVVFEVSLDVTVGVVCADGSATNSDGSFSIAVPSGVDVPIPNTPISANGDLVINQPSTIAKDVVVRYETQGVAPTTIVSGEVVVPDSFAPDPNRSPFTGNYGILFNNSITAGFQADGYGCFSNLSKWTTEPATSQDCTVEYYCGTLYGNNTFFGFSEVLTSLTALGNGFTGVFNNGSSLGYFYANDVYVGTFYNPSTVDDVIKITWNATDGKFRLYVAEVLTYTSTYTKFGSVYPFAGANSGFQPVAGCFVTRLD
jgi:hypothetical protein